MRQAPPPSEPPSSPQASMPTQPSRMAEPQRAGMSPALIVFAVILGLIILTIFVAIFRTI
jgi:hypothetical protein